MVLLLDPYHLGDPLFATALARDLKARGEGLVLVHGSGEAGERALESLGSWPERDGTVWRVADAREAAAVERATRELNRRLVHELNEAGLPTIGAMGADRGLLKASEAGVAAGRVGWVATLVAQGGVPVVAALAANGEDPLQEVDAGQAAAALAAALEAPLVALVRGRSALAEAPTMDLDAAQATGRLGDAGLVTSSVQSGVPVRAVVPSALREAHLPAGVWVGGTDLDGEA